MPSRIPETTTSAILPANASLDGPPVDVEFLGVTFAGHGSRFATLQDVAGLDPRVSAAFREVSGWVPGGLVERAPLLSGGAKGRLRAAIEARRFATTGGEVVWTSAAQAVQPWLLRQAFTPGRPVILDLDWTLAQQERLAPWYYGRPGREGIAWRMARAREALLWRATALFTPWSNWAAESLKAQGVDPSLIRVIPPGVDIARWEEPRRVTAEGPLRVLFVGNDLRRKGLDLLLDVVRSSPDGFELDVVTGDRSLEPVAGVRVHRASPNSPGLMELYRRADIFVMPSRAECFGIAYLEAMASGLPVVAGDSGGVRDIVEEGVTGWIVGADPAQLAGILQVAARNRQALLAMGRAGRSRVEQRFDARANVARLIDEVVEIALQRRSGSRPS